PFLFMVAMLGTRENPGLGSGLYALVPAVVALAVLVGVGRLILRPLFQLVAAAGSNELFVAACLLVVIGTGFIPPPIGKSLALGPGARGDRVPPADRGHHCALPGPAAGAVFRVGRHQPRPVADHRRPAADPGRRARPRGGEVQRAVADRSPDGPHAAGRDRG